MAQTVKLNEFSKIIKDMPSRTLAQVKRGTVSGVARSIPDLVAASPVDTGLYAQSWSFSADEQSVILGNFSPYAAIIEDGTRKGHWTPIEPLLAWAKRVLGDSSQPPQYSARVRSLAYGTRQKIYDQGITPRKVLENMLPTILENIKQEILRGE